MKYFLIIPLLWLLACKQSGKTAQHVKLQSYNIDTTKYGVLKFDSERDHYYFDKNSKPTSLSAEELLMIEDLISKGATQYNNAEKDSAVLINKRLHQNSKNLDYIWKGDFIMEPLRYYKQLLPVINSKGEKEIYISCFCDKREKLYWKKFVISVYDGGSCYFQLKVNLTTKTVYYLYVNGLA